MSLPSSREVPVFLHQRFCYTPSKVRTVGDFATLQRPLTQRSRCFGQKRKVVLAALCRSVLASKMNGLVPSAQEESSSLSCGVERGMAV